MFPATGLSVWSLKNTKINLNNHYSSIVVWALNSFSYTVCSLFEFFNNYFNYQLHILLLTDINGNIFMRKIPMDRWERSVLEWPWIVQVLTQLWCDLINMLDNEL